MRWGIAFSSTAFPEPDRAIAMAQAAENAGFESLWCPEHVVVAVGDSVTPYRASPDGRMDRLWKRGGIPDPLIWLAYVAAQTTRIKLGTNVVILPEHQPVVFAKSAATLDVLSRGRLLLGIGVGELPEEYAAVDMAYTNRGRRMDESIEAMRTLWQEEVASYAGTYVRYENVRCDPSPVRGTIPLHIGGTSEAAVRRAARYGDGYFPFVDRSQDLHQTLSRVVTTVWKQAEALGRDPAAIEMTGGGARTVGEAERFASIGINRLVIAVKGKETAEVEDELLGFGQQVIDQTVDL